jgi:hypothetical protein
MVLAGISNHLHMALLAFSINQRHNGGQGVGATLLRVPYDIEFNMSPKNKITVLSRPKCPLWFQRQKIVRKP